MYKELFVLDIFSHKQRTTSTSLLDFSLCFSPAFLHLDFFVSFPFGFCFFENYLSAAYAGLAFLLAFCQSEHVLAIF